MCGPSGGSGDVEEGSVEECSGNFGSLTMSKSKSFC
jgi:hypothetical protein